MKLRDLPSVDELLRDERLAGEPHDLAVEAARSALARAREEIAAGNDPEPLVDAVLEELGRARSPSLRRVLNATGVLVHTNLGRAPLAEAALARVAEVGGGYSNLEYDLARGERGSRQDHLGPLLERLTGAEAALVVNNNAAAVLLALAALAEAREVVVSRGELIEIGDGFRIPDVLARSGARLVEVGTTNRTRAADYEHAIGPETAVLLRVHQSNFRVVGFAERPQLSELAAIARRHELPLVDDLGSGALAGIGDEPTPAESLRAGADLVCFSGDKLLGGPQAGIVVGRADLVERLRRHPLQRALRADKLTLAALEGTLALALDPATRDDVPVLRMLHEPIELVRARAERLAELVGGEVEETVARVGGGALPLAELPSAACAVEESLAEPLRLGRAARDRGRTRREHPPRLPDALGRRGRTRSLPPSALRDERRRGRAARGALAAVRARPPRPAGLVRVRGGDGRVYLRCRGAPDLRDRRRRAALAEAAHAARGGGLRHGSAASEARAGPRHGAPAGAARSTSGRGTRVPPGQDARAVASRRGLRADACVLRGAWLRAARGAPRPLGHTIRACCSSSASDMPLTVGTAGHIDHGKTWLVRALTGKDTDRLPEEQRRGISIDLGYAPLELPDGRRLSVIDVPGHERFVRTMVAGATGIDLFLLVIDAGEGARPQTHEHLAILRLLGIEHGVVALTKVDAVDEEAIELAEAEAVELVPGVEVVRVSARTGEGLDELRAALARVADSVEHGRADRPTRLYVDRSFSVPGFGTVVTGTLWSGSIGAGDQLRLEPSGRDIRVRSVQVHDRDVGRAEAGQRVAVSLPGIDRRDVARGEALIEPGGYPTSYRLDVALEEIAPIEDDARVQVHLGTTHTPARVVRLGERFAQLRLASPVIAARGDRLILRGETTLGGGNVLDPIPPRHRDVARIERLAQGDVVGTIHAPVLADTLRFVLDGELAEVERAGPWVFSATWLAAYEADLRERIAGADPIDPGIPVPADAWADDVLALLPLERRGSKLYFPGAIATLEGREAESAALERELASAGVHATKVSDEEVARFLEASGRLVRLGDGYAIGIDSFDVAKDVLLAECRAAGEISLARFRDLVGTGRRDAQLLLERFDADGLTRRVGDVRVLRRESGRAH